MSMMKSYGSQWTTVKTDIELQILSVSNKSYSVDTTRCALNVPQERIRTGD